MYSPDQNRFRRDLVTTVAFHRTKDVDQLVWVKNPSTDKLFGLKQEEYFLCLAMDGTATFDAIAVAFQDRFHRSISVQELQAFSGQMHRLGLLEPLPTTSVENTSAPAPNSMGVAQAVSSLPPVDPLPSAYVRSLAALEEKPSKPRRRASPPPPIPELSIVLWSAKNPNAMLARLAWLLRPYRWWFKLMARSLLVIFPVALFTLARHNVWLWQDIKNYVHGNLPNLTFLLVGFGLQGSIAKLASGTVATTYGSAVKKLGFGLFLGILPGLLLSLNDRGMTRQQKIQVYSSPILVRLFIFSGATFIWYNSYGRGTALTPIVLVIIITGLFGLLLDSIPLWPSDGYSLLITQFRLSNIFSRSYQIWNLVLQKQPLPKALNRQEQLGLQAMGVIGFSSLITVIFIIIYFVSSGLAEDFAASILGNAAHLVLFSVMTAFFVHKLFAVWSIMSTGRNQPLPSNGTVNGELSRVSQPEPAPVNFAWFKFLNRSLLIQAALAIATVFILLIPYRFRPGGQIRILPQQEQKIQVPVSGKVVDVFPQDQDEILITAGTPVATLESPELDYQLRGIKEQIAGQLSTIARLEAELARLTAEPRSEEVQIYRGRLESAEAEVEVARQQLESYIQQAELSANRAVRQNQLYEQGVISLQAAEDADRLATTDQNNVQTQRKVIDEQLEKLAIEQANLDLLLAGSHPQEIEAARYDVERAKAELARLKEEESYLQSEVQRTQLQMPFDGYLVTTQLDRKVGTYLNPGDTFAIAKAAETAFLGEILVPESETDQVMLDRVVEIKLFAFSHRPIRGRVISVGPAAVTNETTGTISTMEESGRDVRVVEETAGKVVKVIVLIEDDSGLLIRAGMTGRAKIDGETMPLGVAFSRSLVRFVSVEMWSWLP